MKLSLKQLDFMLGADGVTPIVETVGNLYVVSVHMLHLNAEAFSGHHWGIRAQWFYTTEAEARVRYGELVASYWPPEGEEDD